MNKKKWVIRQSDVLNKDSAFGISFISPKLDSIIFLSINKKDNS